MKLILGQNLPRIFATLSHPDGMAVLKREKIIADDTYIQPLNQQQQQQQQIGERGMPRVS
jgi:hypothetical protein